MSDTPTAADLRYIADNGEPYLFRHEQIALRAGADAMDERDRLRADRAALAAALRQYARPDYYYFLLDPIGQQTDPTKKAREVLAEHGAE